MIVTILWWIGAGVALILVFVILVIVRLVVVARAHELYEAHWNVTRRRGELKEVFLRCESYVRAPGVSLLYQEAFADLKQDFFFYYHVQAKPTHWIWARLRGELISFDHRLEGLMRKIFYEGYQVVALRKSTSQLIEEFPTHLAEIEADIRTNGLSTSILVLTQLKGTKVYFGLTSKIHEKRPGQDEERFRRELASAHAGLEWARVMSSLFNRSSLGYQLGFASSIESHRPVEIIEPVRDQLLIGE